MFHFGIRMILLAIGLCFFGLVLNWHEVALKTHTDTHMRARTHKLTEWKQTEHTLLDAGMWLNVMFSFTQEELRPHVTFLSPLLFLVFSRQEKRKADSVAEFCFFSPGRFVRSAVAVLDTPVLSNITTHPLSHRWHDSSPPHTHTQLLSNTRSCTDVTLLFPEPNINSPL